MGVPLMVLNFFFSGLYFPVAEMPHVLQRIGEYVPFGAVMAAWAGQGAAVAAPGGAGRLHRARRPGGRPPLPLGMMAVR